MENRDLVLSDYFKLRILLNRTNAVRDQKSDVEFIAIKKGLSSYTVAATLSGVSNPKYIELCAKGMKANWKATEFSGLIHLEDFCSKYFRKNLGLHFCLDELKLTASKLKSDLKGLGISR